MRKASILILAAFLAASALSAKSVKKVAESRVGSDVPELQGKLGIGYEAGVGGQNYVTGRFWLADSLGIDASLTMNFSNPATGTDANGRPVNDSRTCFGLGAGAVYNLTRPVDNLAIQALAGLGFLYQSGNVTSAGVSNSFSQTDIGLGVAAGFEAFIPAWQNLSVHGSVGLGLGVTNKSNPANSTSQFSLGTSGNGFTPTAVGIRYYF